MGVPKLDVHYISDKTGRGVGMECVRTGRKGEVENKKEKNDKHRKKQRKKEYKETKK
jgi:hypothetical protein